MAQNILVVCFVAIGVAVVAAVKEPQSRSALFDRANFYWSGSCPSPDEFYEDDAHCCCSIIDHGAVGDNSTLNTLSIQTTIDTCHETCNAGSTQSLEDTRVIAYVPQGLFRTGSILLRSNLRFHLAKGAAIYGSSEAKDYPIVPMVPNGYFTGETAMFRSLLGGSNLVNVSITGENEGYASDAFATFGNNRYNGDNNDDSSVSVVDGVGWKWWCKYRSMPIPQKYCHGFNPNNDTMPQTIFRPKLIEFVNSTNILLSHFTARNSAVWTIHPFLSKDIVMTNLTLLAPREVGNTDGLDPDSCENVVMDSCYIDVGDDGVSIKSTNHSGRMAPTRNVTMRNLRIVSRNWCIGSATFGGIYDILFEDSTIGDPDRVTSPWAIKFKSHRYYPGPMENITIRNIQMGKIGPTPWMYPKAAGSALLIGLSYGNPPPRHPSGKPYLRNLTLENITVRSAGVAGQIRGFPEDCLEGLTVKNMHVLGGRAKWDCKCVNLESLTVSNVFPSLTCTGGCNSSIRSSFHAMDPSEPDLEPE